MFDIDSAMHLIAKFLVGKFQAGKDDICIHIFRVLISIVLCSFFCWRGYRYAVNYLFSFYSGEDAIIANLYSKDVDDILKTIPIDLYNRTLSDIIVDTEDPVYVYGAKFEGKTIYGKLIALHCARNNIPFIYVELSKHDTCFLINKKFGYYSNSFMSKMYRFATGHNRENLFSSRCIEDDTLVTLRQAINSYV